MSQLYRNVDARSGYQSQSKQWAKLESERPAGEPSIVGGGAFLILLFAAFLTGVFGFAYLFRAFTGA